MTSPFNPAGLRRGRGENGAEMIEMAVILPAALFLLFGVVMFGATMNFTALLNQAATEATRTVVATPGTAAEREAAAVTALNDQLAGMNRSCGAQGVTCFVAVAPCPNSADDCLTIEIELDNVNFPVFPRIPIFAEAAPDTITGRSVEELSNTANP